MVDTINIINIINIIIIIIICNFLSATCDTARASFYFSIKEGFTTRTAGH